MGKTALVVFGKDIPRKGDGWWRQFDTLIGPEEGRSIAKERGLKFVLVEELIEPGSVQEAAELVRRLSLIRLPQGGRLSKAALFEGYELWWIHYDDIYQKFCLPYTQYRPLLEYLREFRVVQLYSPPADILFRYFFEAYGVECRISRNPVSAIPPPGVWLQAALSVPFVLWLALRRPSVMMWTSDLFDPPRDHDFRYKFIYEELYGRRISFVEFIRSGEKLSTMLQHALKRRRAVVYSHAITTLCQAFARFLSKKDEKRVLSWYRLVERSPEERFWFLSATHYLRNTVGDRWAARVLTLIVRIIGVRAGIILAAMGRNFPEVLACKLSDLPVLGILHGVASKDYNIYDFMPEFDGKKRLSVDKYGVWSSWWKEYYLTYSKAYAPEQLVVNGLIRPLPRKSAPSAPVRQQKEPLKVLFVSEQLGVPSETMPYLEELLGARDIILLIKFRSYRDRFEDWIKKHRPDVLSRLDPSRILKGTMNEAIEKCDVVVGSHTTGVLEALLQMKPFVLFLSKKWGDYFELESFASPHKFVARTPREFLALIENSREVPSETLSELQERFFGSPYQNGSKWLVEEVEKLL